jgi:hypothetical protein
MTMNTVQTFNLTIFYFVIKQYYEVNDQISYVMYPYISFVVPGKSSHCEKLMNLLIYMNIVSVCLQLGILHNYSVLIMMVVGFF